MITQKQLRHARSVLAKAKPGFKLKLRIKLANELGTTEHYLDELIRKIEHVQYHKYGRETQV